MPVPGKRAECAGCAKRTLGPLPAGDDEDNWLCEIPDPLVMKAIDKNTSSGRCQLREQNRYIEHVGVATDVVSSAAVELKLIPHPQRKIQIFARGDRLVIQLLSARGSYEYEFPTKLPIDSFREQLTRCAPHFLTEWFQPPSQS